MLKKEPFQDVAQVSVKHRYGFMRVFLELGIIIVPLSFDPPDVSYVLGSRVEATEVRSFAKHEFEPANLSLQIKVVEERVLGFLTLGTWFRKKRNVLLCAPGANKILNYGEIVRLFVKTAGARHDARQFCG